MVKDDVCLGENVKIHHPELVNLYGCKISSGCIISPYVEIGQGVIIGERVKIQAFAFIPEGVTIEDEAFIGPHVCFTNDKYPRSTNPDGSLKSSGEWKVTPTVVCKRASIGANATIICGVTIGEESIVGAGSVVTKDVLPHSIVVGNPAKVIRKINDV